MAKNGRGHPDYTFGDVPTKCPAEFFSPAIMVKRMIDANNASNVISEEKRTPYAAMTHLLREVCRKSKWKFKMAFAMKGKGGLEGVSFAIKLF